MPAAQPVDLPLWGWGSTHDIETILWRVYIDNPGQIRYDPEDGFVARDSGPSIPSQAEIPKVVYRHVSWRAPATPYISTTCSYFWALAEAYRRTKYNEPHEIKIAAIRASALPATSMLIAADHLPHQSLVYPDSELTDLKRFADQSQEVLVLHSIPARAVIKTWTFTPDPHPAPELPWVKFNRDSEPKVAAREYAERWAKTFRKDAEHSNFKVHARRCVKLACRLLPVRVRVREQASRGDAGTSLTPREQDILGLAVYLYRWPFKYPPSQSVENIPSDNVPIPTWEEANTIVGVQLRKQRKSAQRAKLNKPILIPLPRSDNSHEVKDGSERGAASVPLSLTEDEEVAECLSKLKFGHSGEHVG